MDLTDFELDRQIDPNELDVEALRQADLFFNWAERSAHAKAEVDRCDFLSEVVSAKLESQIRENPVKFGLVKDTEGAIKAAVRCHKDYIAASETLIEARRVSLLLDKAVQAMQQKKDMLELLGKLHGQQYFAGPAVPVDLPSRFEARKQRTSSNLNEKQAKKARRRARD